MIFHILQPKSEGHSMITFYDCFNFKTKLIDRSEFKSSKFTKNIYIILTILYINFFKLV